MTEGFVEVPRKYEPQRMEYWHKGHLLVSAEPPYVQDNERWCVFLAEEIFEALDLPNAGWKYRILETDIYSVKQWVIGLGQLIEPWAEQHLPRQGTL